MREILDDLTRWRSQGKAVALATVVKVYGSAPRPLGAKMAVSSAGEIVGSVSGGCVEGAVVQEARTVMKTGQPRLLKFGITDQQAWTVGLSCGGEIEVFVEPNLFNRLQDCLRNEQLVALSTVIAGPALGSKMLIWPGGRTEGDLKFPNLTRRVRQRTEILLGEQKSERVEFELDGQRVEVFVEIFPPSPKLILVGAVHVAIPLITFAKELGFRTIVIDPRSAFATPERFAHAHQLIVKWPHEVLSLQDFNEGTYLVVLSHDEKIDNPALKLAVQSPCRYIGALGSKKTHARRVASMKEMGITDQQLARIRAPIGIDLGGRRPEEIAVSIIAEIVAVRNGVQSHP